MISFRDISVKFKILCLVILPTFAYLFVSLVLLSELWDKANKANELGRQIDVFSSISQLKSAVEKERDLATSYLGGGNDILDFELQVQYLDKLYVEFSNKFDHSSISIALREQVHVGIFQLSEIRQLVSEIESSDEELDAESIIIEYEDAINPLLTVEQVVALSVSLKGIGKYLLSIVSLEEAKSDLGKNQGLIAGVLAEDEPLDSDLLNIMFSYKENVNHTLVSHSLAVSEHSKALIDNFRTEVHWDVVNDVFDVLIDSAEFGEYGVLPKEYLKFSQLAINDFSNLISFELEAHRKTADDLSSINKELMIASVSAIIIVGLVILVVGNFVSNMVIQPVSLMVQVMEKIDQTGDLTLRVPVNSEDEIGRSNQVFNELLAAIQSTLKQVNSASSKVLSSTTTMQTELRFTSEMSSAQQTSTEQISTSVREIASGAGNVADIAEKVAGVSQIVDDQSTKGLDIIEKTKAAIVDLSSEVSEVVVLVQDVEACSKEIGTILNVIKDISDQTNLLALNAAIEAARAGESGRGFAVVADEVRTLAARTNDSASQIQNTIERLLAGVAKAVEAVNLSKTKGEEGVTQTAEATTTLTSIVTEIENLVISIHEIASASQEQSFATREISGHLEDILEQSKNTNTATERSNSLCKETIALTNELESYLHRFKV